MKQLAVFVFFGLFLCACVGSRQEEAAPQIESRETDLPRIEPSRFTRAEVLEQIAAKGDFFIAPPLMEQGKRQDPCLTASRCLVSQAPEKHLASPVVILTHGFTGSTFEWEEFAWYLGDRGKNNILVSRVLLGGHGRSLEDFRKATWTDWQAPIINEFRALVDLGYRNINIASLSTSGALVLEALSAETPKLVYKGVAPANIVLIDPVLGVLKGRGAIVAINFFVQLFKLNSSYGPTDPFTPEEFGYWYANRPWASLRQLVDLTTNLGQRLASGFALPANTNLFLFVSKNDPTVDPTAYRAALKGIKARGYGKIRAEEVDSKFHVFTRLNARPLARTLDDERQNEVPLAVTYKDRINQKRAFVKLVKIIESS